MQGTCYRRHLLIQRLSSLVSFAGPLPELLGDTSRYGTVPMLSAPMLYRADDTARTSFGPEQDTISVDRPGAPTPPYRRVHIVPVLYSTLYTVVFVHQE